MTNFVYFEVFQLSRWKVNECNREKSLSFVAQKLLHRRRALNVLRNISAIIPLQQLLASSSLCFTHFSSLYSTLCRRRMSPCLPTSSLWSWAWDIWRKWCVQVSDSEDLFAFNQSPMPLHTNHIKTPQRSSLTHHPPPSYITMLTQQNDSV